MASADRLMGQPCRQFAFADLYFASSSLQKCFADLYLASDNLQKRFADLYFASSSLQFAFADLYRASDNLQKCFADRQFTFAGRKFAFADLYFAFADREKCFAGLQFTFAKEKFASADRFPPSAGPQLPSAEDLFAGDEGKLFQARENGPRKARRTRIEIPLFVSLAWFAGEHRLLVRVRHSKFEIRNSQLVRACFRPLTSLRLHPSQLAGNRESYGLGSSIGRLADR
jgi:hypothetical protein